MKQSLTYFPQDHEKPPLEGPVNRLEKSAMKVDSARVSTTHQTFRGVLISWLARGQALVRLGRPLFLGGSFVLYALGAAVAIAHGHTINPLLYFLGQAVVILFQLMTHYANDYFDYEADHANTTPTRWSGGSRVLVEGELPRSVALGVAILLAVAGAAVMLVLAGIERTGSLEHVCKP